MSFSYQIENRLNRLDLRTFNARRLMNRPFICIRTIERYRAVYFARRVDFSGKTTIPEKLYWENKEKLTQKETCIHVYNKNIGFNWNTLTVLQIRPEIGISKYIIYKVSKQ